MHLCLLGLWPEAHCQTSLSNWKSKTKGQIQCLVQFDPQTVSNWKVQRGWLIESPSLQHRKQNWGQRWRWGEILWTIFHINPPPNGFIYEAADLDRPNWALFLSHFLLNFQWFVSKYMGVYMHQCIPWLYRTWCLSRLISFC